MDAHRPGPVEQAAIDAGVIPAYGELSPLEQHLEDAAADLLDGNPVVIGDALVDPDVDWRPAGDAHPGWCKCQRVCGGDQ